MDEQLKQRILVSVLTFNVTAISFQVLLNMGLFGTWSEFNMLKLLLAIVLGALAAGGSYFLAQSSES